MLQSYQWFVAETDADLAPPSSRKGVRFSSLDRSHLDASLLQKKGRAQRFAERLEVGHEWYGFLDDDGSLASYIWLSRHDRIGQPVPFAGPFSLSLQAGDAYVWDCRTDTRYRGRGLYPDALGHVRRTIARDCTHIWINCETSNDASRRAIAKAGFRATRKCTAIGLGGRMVLLSGLRLVRSRRTVGLRDLAGFPATGFVPSDARASGERT